MDYFDFLQTVAAYREADSCADRTILILIDTVRIDATTIDSVGFKIVRFNAVPREAVRIGAGIHTISRFTGIETVCIDVSVDTVSIEVFKRAGTFKGEQYWFGIICS